MMIFCLTAQPVILYINGRIRLAGRIMEDFLYISFCESIAFLFLWPRMVEKTTDWYTKSVQKDNPHLRICCNARKWITPLLFLILTIFAMTIGLEMAKDFFEIIVLNMLVVITALFAGPLVSQYIVEHYIVGRKNYY